MARSVKGQKSRKYVVKPAAPEELSESDFAACIAVVTKGGAVDWKSATRELPRAAALVLAYEGDEIVGVGTIKRVRRTYAAGISTKSGVDFPPDIQELGYVAVDPDHRHNDLSHRIVTELLTEHRGPLFATTDNPYMKRTLEKTGFVRKGKEWQGNRAKLSFWDKA